MQVLDQSPGPLEATYSLSSSKLGSLHEFLDKHLAMGFIHPSSSAHAAPVLFVHKKDSSLCLCINFQRLNKITKKDRYPLPHIPNLLDTLSCAKVYIKIDLWHAYHLVHITDRDKLKTSFWTCYGSYKGLLIPFGLTNAL